MTLLVYYQPLHPAGLDLAVSLDLDIRLHKEFRWA